MTKGLGIGDAMFGETTGELLKPGVTRQDLEVIERRGQTGPDPFGDVFQDTCSGQRALEQRNVRGDAGRGTSGGEAQEEQGGEPQRQDPSNVQSTWHVPAPPPPVLKQAAFSKAKPRIKRALPSPMLKQAAFTKAKPSMKRGMSLRRSAPASSGRLRVASLATAAELAAVRHNLLH